jgi:hypothetical protein
MTTDRKAGDVHHHRFPASKLATTLMLFTLVAACGGDQAEEAGEAADAAAGAAPSAATGAPAASAATDVTADQLKTAPDQFVGRDVRVSNLAVATPVGTQAFFLDVPQSPFLVKLDQTLIDQARPLPTGIVTVVGPMRAMNDSIMRDWLSKGYIGAGDQILVEFSTHFIEARSVEPGAAPAP